MLTFFNFVFIHNDYYLFYICRAILQNNTLNIIFMIKFKNLPEHFDLDSLEKLLYDDNIEIIVNDSPFSCYKICCVPYYRILVRHSVYFSHDSCDFIFQDGYCSISEVFKFLMTLKSYVK